VVGNLAPGGSSYRLGSGREFVIEGDEYDSAFFDKTAKFLKYLPDIAIVGNIEFDHADIYSDLDAVRLAFRRLVNLVPRRGLLVLGADCADAMALKSLARSRVETFGLSESADWHGYDVTPVEGGTSFRVQHHRVGVGTFEVPLVGAYNVRNALAAMAVAAEVGVSPEAMREGLATFAGVRRRLEMVGSARGVTVFDDFAHHPTAVRETLDGVRAAHPSSRIWAVFEPRSASSCRSVFQREFAQSFGSADQIVIAGLYRSSLPPEERLSTDALIADLHSAGQQARYIQTVDGIVTALSHESRPGDLVVVMSNGGFGGIHAKLLNALTTKVE